MRLTIALDREIRKLLQAEGFKRKGDVFLRIHGDGILQSIYEAREPGSAIFYRKTDPYICISIHSIYEPNVFGDIKTYRGVLQNPYDHTDFDLQKDIKLSPCELLEHKCLPLLNQCTTQELYCDLIQTLDTARLGEVRWSKDKMTIPSLMWLGKYALALEKCNSVLLWNQNIHNIIEMRKLLMEGDEARIKEFLIEAKKNNLEAYSALKFR